MPEQYFMITDWCDPSTIHRIGVRMDTPTAMGFGRFSDIEYPVMLGCTFPESMLEEAHEIASKRQELKYRLDESMGLVYQFINKKVLKKEGQ